MENKKEKREKEKKSLKLFDPLQVMTKRRIKKFGFSCFQDQLVKAPVGL
jgi:hypothetical protein